MLRTLIIASATVVALGAPAVQAAPACPIFPFIFFSKVQCALTITHGSGNTSLIDQDQRGYSKGLNLAAQYQNGDDNNAYTGQTGTNEVAFTVQNGNHNTAYTSQAGVGQGSVTVQNGSGMWAATSSAGANTAVIQSN